MMRMMIMAVVSMGLAVAGACGQGQAAGRRGGGGRRGRGPRGGELGMIMMI
jgi:hypothetical protein